MGGFSLRGIKPQFSNFHELYMCPLYFFIVKWSILEDYKRHVRLKCLYCSKYEPPSRTFILGVDFHVTCLQYYHYTFQ